LPVLPWRIMLIYMRPRLKKNSSSRYDVRRPKSLIHRFRRLHRLSECGVQTAKSAGFNFPQLAALE
jgi:hypothetical protein